MHPGALFWYPSRGWWVFGSFFGSLLVVPWLRQAADWSEQLLYRVCPAALLVACACYFSLSTGVVVYPDRLLLHSGEPWAHDLELPFAQATLRDRDCTEESVRGGPLAAPDFVIEFRRLDKQINLGEAVTDRHVSPSVAATWVDAVSVVKEAIPAQSPFTQPRSSVTDARRKCLDRFDQLLDPAHQRAFNELFSASGAG
jgi:hypothetical protein